VGIALASTVAGQYNQAQVAKKQDKNLAAQIRQQMATSQKVAGKTAQLTAAEQQATNDQPQETTAKTAYDNALKANAANSAQPFDVAGAVSGAYKDDAKNAALGAASYADTKGTLLSQMQAPITARQSAQRGIDDYGIQVGQLNQGQNESNYVNNLKLQGITQNPWLALMSGVGNAYARAKVGSLGYGGGDDGTFGLSSATGSPDD